jgi:hypothetical protein
MRQMTEVGTSIYWMTLLLASYGGISFSREAQGAGQRTETAAKTVASFDVEGLNTLDALLQLGRQARTPLGIEYLNPADLERPVSLHVNNTSVGSVVRAILEQRTAYTWNVQDGVIHIGHTGLPSGDRNVLDHVLSEFSTGGSTDLVTAATVMLPGQLRRQESPPKPSAGVAGIFGSVLGGRAEDQVGPLMMHGVTVRQVLNRLVSEGNKAAWVVLVPPAQMGELPAKGAWYVIAYGDPRRDWGPFILTLLRRNWEPQATQGRK